MVKLNLEVEGEMKEFNIPSDWNDVTVGQYIKIHEVDRELLTEIEASVEIMSALTNIDEDTLFMMNPDDFKLLAEQLAFLNKEVEPNELTSITIDGDEYFVKDNFDKLSMGEIVSIELLIEQSNGKLIRKFPELLCIFLRKKKENGKLEGFRKSFMERAERFKQIKIADVNNLFLFFSNGENSSINNMKDYLENQEPKK